MKPIAALAPLSLLTLPAQAASPTTAQNDEFYTVCMGIAQNDTLCACKIEAAMTLIDERFMVVVIASMKGRATATEDAAPYNSYAQKATRSASRAARISHCAEQRV
ncbi:MAG: hypothetical protein MO852_11840 [Candidatus Devosia euplotis]|nr:hypothetical protein [Candidatus Devosia euplotis]